MTTARNRIGQYVVASPAHLRPLLEHIEEVCKGKADDQSLLFAARVHAARKKDFEGQYQGLMNFVDEAGAEHVSGIERWIAARKGPPSPEHKDNNNTRATASVGRRAADPVSSVLARAFGEDTMHYMMGDKLVRAVRVATVHADGAQRAGDVEYVVRVPGAPPARVRSPRRYVDVMPRLQKAANATSGRAITELLQWLRNDISFRKYDPRASETALTENDMAGLISIQDVSDHERRMQRLSLWVTGSQDRREAVEMWLDQEHYE